MFRRLINWIQKESRSIQFKKVCQVNWDKDIVTIVLNPPQKNQNVEKFTWNSVERVCLEVTGKHYSDEVYFFTNLRLEAFIVPLDAKNGEAFMNEVVTKKLFDNQFVVSNKYSQIGQYWWPEKAA